MRSLRIAAATLVIFFAASLVLWRAFLAGAQTSCQNPPPATHGGWAQNSTGVTYRIPSNATAEQTTQINQAFQSWTTANQSNNSNVSFSNMGSSAGPAQITITLCNTPGCAPGGNPAFTSGTTDSSGATVSAQITIDTTQVPTTDSDVLRAILHEIGHTMGLGDLGQPNQPNCGMVAGGSVMNSICNGSFANIPTSVTTCDNNGVNALPQYPPPPPPDPPPADPGSGTSPIILALGKSTDYQLTGPQGGVWFDLDADGIPERTAWTQAGEPVGFLALDRNHNGIIDNGQELFGNLTPLGPNETAANGFVALAWFDRPENGGNGNGWIDPGDAIWPSLRVWIDFNHDGVSQPDELFTLAALNISALSTTASREMRRDRFGNTFRFRGEFIINGQLRHDYDVFFLRTP